MYQLKNYLRQNSATTNSLSRKAGSSLGSSEKQLRLPVITVVLSILYNALLAFTNAHILRIGTVHVVITEILLIIVPFVWATTKARPRVMPWITYLCAVSFLFIGTYFFSFSLGHETGLKPIRDLLIVCSFGMLGSALAGQLQYLKKIFLIICVCEITFLLIENFAVNWFVKIFQITDYYINTRMNSGDLQNKVERASGLFFTAQSFSGRFTLGFRTAQRLSSIFLEPTTHANFGVLVFIYLTAFWRNLRVSHRTLFALTSALILLGTDSRQFFGMLCLLTSMKVIGLHRIPRITLLGYVPLCLLVMLVFFYDPSAPRMDDLSGRLTYSINQLVATPFTAWLGGNQGTQIFDSGYTYMIYSHSIVGAVLFWLMLAWMPAYSTPEQRYVAHAIMLFYVINLAVSGSTIFSMKTSALLWFMVGILRYRPSCSEAGPKYPQLAGANRGRGIFLREQT